MKKRFDTIDALHAYIERQARRTIKHYYTDWKNYDRPAMMKATGEKTTAVYIILRESGSYLYTADDLKREYPAAVMNYYTQDSTAKYYKVDFKHYTAERIPAGLPEENRTY